MKVIAINGSPRKSWNTATLLKHTLEGAASQGAETEVINLYELDFKGCTSCFACKRKDGEHGKCAMRDDLSPVLIKLRDADAIIFGSPIYYSNITSGILGLLERLLFSNSIYSTQTPTVFPKKIPSAFLYTMNVTEEHAVSVGYLDKMVYHEKALERMLGKPVEAFYCFNTYQFSDYDKYESSMFSESAKAKYKKEQFPIDCHNAFELGVRLVQI